jgi:hypothetical protein
MALLILRLHPVEPVDGDDFTDYLDGLQAVRRQLREHLEPGSAADRGRLGPGAA